MSLSSLRGVLECVMMDVAPRGYYPFLLRGAFFENFSNHGNKTVLECVMLSETDGIENLPLVVFHLATGGLFLRG